MTDTNTVFLPIFYSLLDDKTPSVDGKHTQFST